MLLNYHFRVSSIWEQTMSAAAWLSKPTKYHRQTLGREKSKSSSPCEMVRSADVCRYQAKDWGKDATWCHGLLTFTNKKDTKPLSWKKHGWLNRDDHLKESKPTGKLSVGLDQSSVFSRLLSPLSCVIWSQCCKLPKELQSFCNGADIRHWFVAWTSLQCLSTPFPCHLRVRIVAVIERPIRLWKIHVALEITRPGGWWWQVLQHKWLTLAQMKAASHQLRFDVFNDAVPSPLHNEPPIWDPKMKGFNNSRYSSNNNKHRFLSRCLSVSEGIVKFQLYTV